MGLIADQDHLTVTDPAFEVQRQKTWPGMAHFAGTGPLYATCRECVFWDNCGADPGYYAASGRKRGGIKPRSCRKYQTMMNGEQGPGVPHNSMACKHFARNDTPPSITYRSE